MVGKAEPRLYVESAGRCRETPRVCSHLPPILYRVGFHIQVPIPKDWTVPEDMARISSDRLSHSLMEPGEQRELSIITKFLLII